MGRLCACACGVPQALLQPGLFLVPPTPLQHHPAVLTGHPPPTHTRPAHPRRRALHYNLALKTLVIDAFIPQEEVAKVRCGAVVFRRGWLSGLCEQLQPSRPATAAASSPPNHTADAPHGVQC